jgi:EmrB/QacA subfamily drug resistance transporter
MVGVASAMLLAALDQTIVGTAMPRVIADLHGFEHYSGVITAYMIASTATVPIVGKLSDFYGRRLFLLGGVIVFVAASLLCGAAQSMLQLIAFRGLQGVGAGMTTSMAFTTIADLFPPARRGRVSGVMGSIFGFAGVIGPAIGGVLTDRLGWRSVFYVNLPVGALAFSILYFKFPRVRAARAASAPKIDYAGAITLILTVVPLLLALSWGGRDYPWDSPTVLALLGFGLVCLAVFFVFEKRAPEPIIPLHLFKNRVVAMSLTGSSLVAIAMFGTTLFLPLFIQTVIGGTATRSGAVLMPMTLALISAAMTSGQIMTRTGRYRKLAIGGVTVAFFGMFLLSRMDGSTPYSTIMRNIVILGAGLGVTMPVFNLAVQNAVNPRFVGAATASVQFMRSIGGSLGAAIFGSVLANRFAPAFHRLLSPEVLSALTPAQLASLDNPQSLARPGAESHLESLFAGFGGRAQEVLTGVRAAARAGLASSLQEVFLLGACLLAFAVLAAWRLEDIPLRKSNRVEPEAAANL